MVDALASCGKFKFFSYHILNFVFISHVILEHVKECPCHLVSQWWVHGQFCGEIIQKYGLASDSSLFHIYIYIHVFLNIYYHLLIIYLLICNNLFQSLLTKHCMLIIIPVVLLHCIFLQFSNLDILNSFPIYSRYSSFVKYPLSPK